MKRNVLACLAVVAAGCFTSVKGRLDLDVNVDTGTDTADTQVDVDADADVPEDSSPCPEGWVLCGGECTDLMADPDNCGECSHECPSGRWCVHGECTCRVGLTECGGECVDTATDPSHCGACGIACTEGWVCSEGTCALECGTGLTNCRGACVDLLTDEGNCGACENVCPPAIGAVPTCDSGTCTLVCLPDRWDRDPYPGCEYECVFVSPTESCNAVDDNCDTLPDEGLGCVMGAIQSCTTPCSSGGSHTCEAPSCTWGACCAPMESCTNGCDDDCDTIPDDGCPELCNGVDDDGDTLADETFPCVLGTLLPCTTGCTTPGNQRCLAPTCTPGPCCAPSETCGNGCDDDCDTFPDDGCTIDNDTCSSPLDVTVGGRFTGSTATAADNAIGSCTSSTGGKDVFFRFTLGVTSDVFVSTFGSGFDSVLYVGTTCGGSDRGCNDDYQTGVILQSRVQMGSVPPGTYYITLDGYGSTASGNYVLDVYATPTDSPGDRCGHLLAFDTPLTGEDGGTCTLSSEYSGTCGNPTPPSPPADAVYFVVVTGTGTRSVTFSTCNTITNFDTILYVRDICTSPSTETACVDDPPTGACIDPNKSIVTTPLTPGVHYLFVEAYGNTAGECGSYRITATGL